MPAKIKLFEKKKDHKEILCSRISLSNAIRPCSLLDNQYKKKLNIPQTPKTPKIKRIRKSLKDKISVPKFPVDQIIKQEEFEITQQDLDNLQYNLFDNIEMIRPTFYL